LEIRGFKHPCYQLILAAFYLVVTGFAQRYERFRAYQQARIAFVAVSSLDPDRLG
jgi:hypothetical protein